VTLVCWSIKAFAFEHMAKVSAAFLAKNLNTLTIGIDFRLKTVELKGKTIKVQVWDTAGQERFRTITHNYYRGAHGIALVYDVTHQASFDNIRKWIQDVGTYAEQSVNIVLIGNKCDLSERRSISTEDGARLAKEYGIAFFETSAKQDINVQEAFGHLVKLVSDRLFSEGKGGPGQGGGSSGAVDINAAGEKKKGCC